MTKVVKMCDMSKEIAARIFEMLNPKKVSIKEGYFHGMMIVTDIEPKDLVYPEGWYYAKGNFTNKHNSTTGVYGRILMVKSNGKSWDDFAAYSTQDE